MHPILEGLLYLVTLGPIAGGIIWYVTRKDKNTPTDQTEDSKYDY